MSVVEKIWTDQAIDNSAVTANGDYDILVSAEKTNQSDYNSLRVVIDYNDVLPEDDAIANTFFLTAVLESDNGGTGAAQKWAPIAYQFSGYRKEFQGTTREIVLQPNLVVLDQGLDDAIFVGNQTIARISRQQGKLVDSKYRIRIVLTEEGYGGAGAFTSGKVSAYTERFNV